MRYINMQLKCISSLLYFLVCHTYVVIVAIILNYSFFFINFYDVVFTAVVVVATSVCWFASLHMECGNIDTAVSMKSKRFFMMKSS